MSRIQELIKELCPNGVEYEKIGDLANYRRGSFPQPYTNINFYGGVDSMPFVQVGDVREDFKLVDKTKNTISKIAQSLSVFVPSGTVIVTLQGTIGRVAITQYDCYVDRTLAIFEDLSTKLNKKYFVYQLKNKFDYEKQFARGSTIKTITKEEMTSFKIPIPPLEVQEEIVRILDKFVKLQAELEEELDVELETRKQQYEFWRKYLFNDDNIKNIEDICLNISSGGTPNTSRREYYAGNIPWLRTQEVNWNIIYDTELKITEEAIKNSSAKVIPKNCVIVAMYGATVGKVAINNIPLSTNQACCNLEINPRIADYKYVFYWLSSQYKYIKSLGQGSQTNINAQIVRKLKIPIPPIKEQQKIVQILDKFDKLVNDILEELSVEVDLRKKQYEYYRNKLLSFKEF